MKFGAVAGGQGPDNRFGGKDGDSVGTAIYGLTVSGGAVGEQVFAEHQHRYCFSGKANEAAVRQVSEVGGKGDLFPAPGPDAMNVKMLVDLACQSPVSLGMRPRPAFHEMPQILPAAAETGPVPGCEGHGFIEEEKLRVAARCHQLAPLPLVLQPAGNPTRGLPSAFTEGAVFVMENAAIPHQVTPVTDRHEFTSWCDTILKWHEATHVH